MIGTNTDITERKQMEIELLASQERLEHLISSSPTVIYICSASKPYPATYVSKNIYKLCGYRSEDFLQDPGFWADHIHPDDRKSVFSKLPNIFKNGFYSHEYRLLHKDGHYIWACDELKLIRDDSGKSIEIVGTCHDITERKQAEDQVKASLKEKEVLLKEIHHRVKNNLQVISSLLNLQSRYIKDDKVLEIFNESQNRVKSLALMHEFMYQSKDLSKIDFSEYIKSLVNHLFQSYNIRSNSIGLKVNVKEFSPTPDMIIPCGLIITELVSNSLKHAFPERETGEICVEASSNGKNSSTMSVRDNGVGFPKRVDFQNPHSFGLELVNILVKQLKGQLKLQKKQGTEFKITFKNK